MITINNLKQYFDFANAWEAGIPDINDSIFDFLTHLEYDKDINDSYDRCLDYIAAHLDVIELAPNTDYGVTCDICGLIENYRSAFDRFMNEENAETYTPAHYVELYGEVYTPNDEEYYDLYLQTFDCLLGGSYSNSDYDKLYSYMVEMDANRKSAENTDK